MKPNIDIEFIFQHRNFKAPELAKTILTNYLEKELLIIALSNDLIKSNRAMWVLNHCADLDYLRVKPFQTKLINHLKQKNIHTGVIRSILRIIQHYPIQKKHETFLLDKCLGYIINPSEAIAVRVFAMSIVFIISKPFPELLNELSIILQHIITTENSAALCSRARITLKDIAKHKPIL